MDACHFLLGRPWQFDHQDIHDGGKNSYTFKKDNLTFKIQSLMEDGEEKTTSPNVLMVSEKDFLQNMEESEGIGFALMLRPKEGNKYKETKRSELPKEIQGMLQAYQGIVSDGQSSTLPPQRVISHRIDLIPGATLPNKLAYKMTPQQNEEIARQIQELLNQGINRKSVSPCFIPTVLTPKKGGTWRICTNSRAINRITIRCRFPIPRIEDLMEVKPTTIER